MQEHRRKSKLQKFGETVVLEHLSKLRYTCVFLVDRFPLLRHRSEQGRANLYYIREDQKSYDRQERGKE
jgi:hypothetical protein